jgi:hypothetical protein
MEPSVIEPRDRASTENAQANEIDIWRKASIERYDSGDEQYLATHPTRDGFLQWLEAQCVAKRERLSAVRAGAALYGGAVRALVETALRAAAPDAVATVAGEVFVVRRSCGAEAGGM